MPETIDPNVRLFMLERVHTLERTLAEQISTGFGDLASKIEKQGEMLSALKEEASVAKKVNAAIIPLINDRQAELAEQQRKFEDRISRSVASIEQRMAKAAAEATASTSGTFSFEPSPGVNPAVEEAKSVSALVTQLKIKDLDNKGKIALAAIAVIPSIVALAPHVISWIMASK